MALTARSQPCRAATVMGRDHLGQRGSLREKIEPVLHAATLRPTRVRYWVLVFTVTLAVVTYIDRVAISFALPYIGKDLNLDSIQKGWVLTAFALAYSIFEIPGGFLGDWM